MRCHRIVLLIKENLLMILTILAVFIGFIIGVLLRKVSPGEEALMWIGNVDFAGIILFSRSIGMPGDIFIRLLKLTILPLIAASVIKVTATLDPKENGKITLVAFVFIVASNIIAGICGASASLLLKPGILFSTNASREIQEFKTEIAPKTSDIFADLLYNLFPDNIVGISLFQSRTVYTVTQHGFGNETVQRTITNVGSANMLGILFCSFIFGIAASSAGEVGKPFLDFMNAIATMVFKIMNVLLHFTPIGVCFMIAGPLAAVGDIGKTFSQLGIFMATVVVGLLAHLVVMFGIYAVSCRANPFRLLPYCFRTWLIAFTTLAPVVAIPDMYTASDRFGIDVSLSRFVVPLTATLKGDGSAAFLSASAIFIAQINNFPITAATVVTVILLSAAAVFAIPNIPSSSLVVLVTILSALGVPANYVGLLFAIDWLMDRCRTTNLALLHLYCVAFTQYLCKGAPSRTQEKIASSLAGEDTAVSNGDINQKNDAISIMLLSDAPYKTNIV